MSKIIRLFFTCILVTFLLRLGQSSAWAQEQSARQPDRSPAVPAINVTDGFTVSAVGDLILVRPESMRIDAAFNNAVRLLKGSDIVFGNFEGTAADLKTFKGHPQAESGGSWFLYSPEVPQDLKSMGFSLVARANNHATDWGVEGIIETDRLLDQAGIMHAGTGEDRAAARAARYLETPKGRIALVATTASFTPMSQAAPPAGEAPGRPGVSVLRTRRYVRVTADEMQTLRSIRDRQPKGSLPVSLEKEKPNDLDLFGTRYRLSTRPGFEYEMTPADLEQVLKSIRQGKENSDFVIVSIHAHEPGNWSDDPADFLPIFAHAAIDNGADMLVGHGPHRLRGIEIYKGKPIFYSLGNFFFEENLQHPIPAELWEQMKADPQVTTEAELAESRRVRWFKEDENYQSVITVSHFEHGQLSEMRLYPIYLEANRNSDRGVPRVPTPQTARVILERLQNLCRPFGTTLEIKDQVGIIHVSAQK
jgi:poly-gamma-glutamate capsule biosynthesis protein CapA/YwtB (metallophosphatase superfamily)